MNIEFLLLIFDYFRIIKFRDFVLDWIIPFIIAVLLFYLNLNNLDIKTDAVSNCSMIISLLGVLIGFSIAVITLLVTSNTPNVEEIKNIITTYINGTRPVSLFDLLLSTYVYSVVVEIILVIINILLPIICKSLTANTINIINSIDILLTIHILLLTLRNVTNYYFVLVKGNR